MKKWTALLLALGMLCAGASAFALEAADVIGLWYMNKLLLGEFELDTARIGSQTTLNFAEDGTAVMATGTEETAFAWSIEGDALLCEERSGFSSCSMEDGNLIGETILGTMVFGRSLNDGYKTLPEVVEGAKREAFYGDWEAKYYVDPDLAGEATPYNVSEGGLNFCFTIDEDSFVWNFMGLTVETYPYTFENGEILVRMSLKRAASVCLCEDGSLRIDPGYHDIYYCEPMVQQVY